MDAEARKMYVELNLQDKERFKRESEQLKQQQREARKAAGLSSEDEGLEEEVRCEAAFAGPNPHMHFNHNAR